MTAVLFCWIIALFTFTGQVGDLSFTESTASAGTVYTGVPLSHRFEFQNVFNRVQLPSPATGFSPTNVDPAPNQ